MICLFSLNLIYAGIKVLKHNVVNFNEKYSCIRQIHTCNILGEGHTIYSSFSKN